MTASPTIPRGSKEYVKATVRADVTLADAMTVEISLTPASGAHVWLPGAWTGTAATTRVARTANALDFTTGNYPLGSYTVFVRLTDTPEVPIMNAGRLNIAG